MTLPVRYTGGELMVGHNEEWKAYRGSKTALSLVAFYADCNATRFSGDVGLPDHAHLQPAPAATPAVRRATGEPPPTWRTCSAKALQHAGGRYYCGPATDPPNRLVYLLDHEYTARGLTGGG